MKKMEKNNLVCPECSSIISFQNVIGFDDEQMNLLGIQYLILCLNCGHQFYSDSRSPRRLKDKEYRKVMNELDEKLRKKTWKTLNKNHA